jgi:lipoyl-dependent peroxiredoxin
MATRSGSAEWRGDLQSGTGTVTVGDHVFDGSYSYDSRFGEGEGTNPEELIAAAHAACFTMALSGALTRAGHTPEALETTAKVDLRNVDGKPTLARIDLEVEGRVPGIGDEEFQRAAEEAKDGCPVSRALAGIPEMVVAARRAATTGS